MTDARHASPLRAIRVNEPLPQRKHVRIRGYDYSLPGMYFVTICAHGRALLFGEAREDGVVPSDLGRIVQGCWEAIPEHYPGVVTDAFVVMPNHVHGILDFTQRPVVRACAGWKPACRIGNHH